jgi:hypothetical protein
VSEVIKNANVIGLPFNTTGAVVGTAGLPTTQTLIILQEWLIPEKEVRKMID